MAIAELAREIETEAQSPKFEHAKIENYTPQKTIDLLKRYSYNRSLLDYIVPINPTKEEATILGTMEIQESVLKMLGQEFQLKRRSFDAIAVPDYLGKVKINDFQLEALTDKYFDNRVSFLLKGLHKKNLQDMSPGEAKLFGRVGELSSVLVELGQTELVSRINQITQPQRQIDWAKMRSSGRGELQ